MRQTIEIAVVAGLDEAGEPSFIAQSGWYPREETDDA